jgi:hypothetical protein
MVVADPRPSDGPVGHLARRDLTYREHATHALRLAGICLGTSARLVAHAIAPERIQGVNFTLEKERRTMEAKSLSVTNMDEARSQVSDIQVHGDPGAWECVCKASSQAQGWTKSTKRMPVDGGWLYQVSTQQQNSDGSYAVAEAVCFVPDSRRAPLRSRAAAGSD